MSFNPDKNPLIPGGEFIICRHTFFTGQACGASNTIWINREAREMSRHMKSDHTTEHSSNNNQVKYEECAIVTRDAAVALVGEDRVYRAEGKDRNGLVERPFNQTPRYPDWLPVKDDVEATALAASAAIANNAREENPELECREPVARE